MLAATQSTTGDIIIWSLVLIGGVAVLGGFVWLIRHWAFAAPEQSTDEWSLQHLRDLKAEGRITDEEFQTLREKVISQYRQDEE